MPRGRRTPQSRYVTGSDGGRPGAAPTAATRSRTSRSRTARSTRSTKSRSRWARASASADTMALISSKLTNIVPWSGCALFLQQPDGDIAEVPLRGGRRCAAAARTRRCEVGEGLSGWVAQQPPDARQRRPARQRSRRPDCPAHRAQVGASSARCTSSDTFIGCLALYHTEPQPLHRGSPPAARAGRRTGRRRSSTTRSSSSRRRKIR